MAEEEKIEVTTPESNTEEFIDDNGLKHVVVRDTEGKPISDQTFDKNGKLIGEGIYKDGEFAGRKEYFSHSEQGQTFDHIAEYDADGKVVSDRKFDKDGKLIGEGIYKDGEFIEEQKYNDVPAVRGQEMPARTQETQQEQPDLHPVRVEQTAEQEQPDLHPVRVEQTAETVNTVLPAVRGNEMPERAQEPVVLEGQEANLAQSLGNYAQKPSKESFEAFAFDLQHVVADYVGSGMTPAAATQKASELLGQLYDRAESQNLDPQILANLRNAKEAANKFMAQEVEKLNATPAMLNEVNAGRQDENIEDVEFEEIPAAPVAENEGNESDDTPAAPANINEGNESDDTPAAPAPANTNQSKGNVAAPANTNDGHEADDASADPTPANANESKGNTADPESKNENEDNGVVGSFRGENNETEDDLLKQMMNTAFKNRYMMLEDVENDSSHLCPFRQFKTSTLEDRRDSKNPYVKMELETGARVYNRPGQIDVHYDTKEGDDLHISFEDALALVRLGQEKGWTSANLEGPKEYKEQMYLAMCALGMKVHGDFIPSKDLQKKAEEMRQKYSPDAQHAASIDQRFKGIEKIREDVGIKKPEDVGKEFMQRIKDAGLDYRPPVQQQNNEEEKETAPQEHANVKEYSEKLKEISGVDWEFKDAESSNLQINNLRAPDSKELREKLDAAGIRYEEAVKGDKKLLTVDTDKPLHLTEDEKKAKKEQESHTSETPVATNGNESADNSPVAKNNEQTADPKPQQVERAAHETPQKPQTALVPVTPEIQNKMEAVALTSTTALAKTDPARAQQASAQIAATSGIANQLQLAGRTANEAKGNDVKAAQQQHQQETALVLAARNNNRTK